jgi:hypothetical protein
MAQPNTVDQLTAGARRSPFEFYKPAVTAKAAGTFTDLFLHPGNPGAATAPSISGTACDRNTVGAIPMSAVPATKEAWLTSLAGNCSIACSVALYDRLVHWAGINGTLTTAQTLGAVALSRYTDGVGVFPYLEFWSAVAHTTTTLTISYTNTASVAGRTASVVIPASPSLGQTLPFPLQAGDMGCLSIQSAILTATTAQVGNIGIFLGRRLAKTGGAGNQEFPVKDWLSLGMPNVGDGACLSFLERVSTTSTGEIDLAFTLSDV